MEDEKRQIGQLICGLVQRVDYGRDFEKQLSFYAEARAAFPNLDSVHIQLVQVLVYNILPLQITLQYIYIYIW